ncbi:hypothetical protein FPRO05_02087 [Fusarium proliferatum]|uniref:FAR1 domain-containing protein n=1 Tax=Gibberella intermedia TaxID=948311 RepID=A0A365N956_GIBIN|nr:hypothetical protein FPRO05_02087 [Fusarium proliferatum]
MLHGLSVPVVPKTAENFPHGQGNSSTSPLPYAWQRLTPVNHQIHTSLTSKRVDRVLDLDSGGDMFGILETVQVPHSGIYNSYEELFKQLSDGMEKEGYKIVKARSHRGKVGGADVPGNDIVRCDLVCDRGGRPYRCMATKHKTTTKKTDCPWKAKAVHRKTMGGWVLTITCDQHNHEPGTPEPPTPEAASEEETNIMDDLEGEHSLDPDATPLLTPWQDEGPQPDQETQAAIQVAGVSNAVLRLTGETFHQFKSDHLCCSE